MQNAATKQFVQLISDPCIANHRAAWELLEGLETPQVLQCMRALLQSDYEDARVHLRGYVENAAGPLRLAAAAVLAE